MRKKRLRDIPKGKRWEHFLIYYGKQLFLGLICAGMVLYALYLAFWKPAADFSVLILSDSFDLSCEMALRECFSGQAELDRNGDGTVRVLLNYFSVDPQTGEIPAEERMALMTILSAGDTDLFLANVSAAVWLRDNALIADWGDAGRTGIPVADIALFQGPAFDAIRDLSVYVACPRAQTQQWQEKTEALMDALR